MGRLRDAAPRAALALSVLLGVVYFWYSAALNPAFALNYRVYRAAAAAALSGDPFYGVVPAGLGPSYVYLYPPGTVPFFYPTAVLDVLPGYAAFVACSVAAGLVVAWLVVRTVERERGRLQGLDRGLIAATAVGSSLSAPSLVYGNVNLLLAALVGLALATRELASVRDRGALAGAGLGLAAATKLFPAAFGVVLLRQRATGERSGLAAARRDPLVGALLATGAVVGVGAVLFGVGAHVTYVETVLADRLSGSTVAPASPFVTLRRPLVALGVDPAIAAPVAVALAAAAVLALLGGDWTDRRSRLAAGAGTVVAVVIALPSFPLYLVFAYYPLLSVLYLADGRRRWLLAGGVALLHVAVQADDVARLVDLAGGGGALTVIRPTLAVATPPLVGAILVLAGCLSVVRDRAGS